MHGIYEIFRRCCIIHYQESLLCPRIEKSGYIIFVLSVYLSVCLSDVNFNIYSNLYP